MHNLYETTLEGPFLRGAIKGDLARLERKPIFTYTPRYSDALPQEANLSIFNQLRAHIATAIISAGITAAIDSQIPYPRLEIIWSKGSINIIPILGVIIGWLLTNNILELASESVHQLTSKDKRYCLHAGLNILTVVGLLYLIISPFIFESALPEIVVSIPFLVTIMILVTINR